MIPDSSSPATELPSPLISLSIVSHGHASTLRPLLDSVVAHESANQLQIIVTDNLGRDLPEYDPAPWHSWVFLRNERPQGFARNHNTASKLAQGAYFCVLNPDVLFVEAVLRFLIECLESGQGDIAAPLIYDSRGVLQDSFRRLPTPWELFRRRTLGTGTVSYPVPSQTIIYPDWLAGIFLLMRRETFARLGGFDEGYRLYLEDVDFCTRARLAGLVPCVNPRVRLQHDARRTSRADSRYFFWHLQSAFRFFTSGVYRAARRGNLPGTPTT